MNTSLSPPGTSAVIARTGRLGNSCAAIGADDAPISSSAASDATGPFMTPAFISGLLRLQSGFLDDQFGGGAILPDEARERLRRARHRLQPALDQNCMSQTRQRADTGEL